MRELRFGSVAQFYSADETLIPNASYRGDANQDQTRHSIGCLRNYFESTCKRLATQPHLDGTDTPAIASQMAI